MPGATLERVLESAPKPATCPVVGERSDSPETAHQPPNTPSSAFDLPLPARKVARSTFYFDLDIFKTAIRTGTAISKPTAMKMITMKPPNAELEGTPVES